MSRFIIAASIAATIWYFVKKSQTEATETETEE